MSTKVFAAGELVVTDTGEVVIEETLPRSRALLVQPENYITVEFDSSEPPPPPCAGGGVDELDWELFMHRTHHVGGHEEELKMKIFWSVQTARTIKWRIKVPA
jgi:hypothetical protein